MNNKPKWNLVKAFKGHRYFESTEYPNKLLVVDHSGEYPDQTKNGVLFVDPTRSIDVYSDLHHGKNLFIIPLLSVNGNQYATISEEDEIIWLYGIKHIDMTFSAFEIISKIIWSVALPILFPEKKIKNNS